MITALILSVCRLPGSPYNSGINYGLKLMTFLYLGTIEGVAVWTCIEPSVGVVCSCLPTLRPLLQEMQIKGGHFRAFVRSTMTSTRQDDSFQLESGIRNTGKASSTHHTKWIDNPDFQTNKNISNESAVTTLKDAPASDRDDVMLMGVNVQRDVLVERTRL